MDEPLKTKSITLSCGKLTTGVTVRPWTGILMLRNSSSPETYFQAALRVRSPWTVKNPDGNSPNDEQVIKEQCYVFDFAPDRAFPQIADYSCRLNMHESNPEKKVAEFISFLPVLAYDGSSMKLIDAAGILDMASGVQTGLNFANSLPELFAGKERGEDALRVLREGLKIRARILADISTELPHVRAALKWAGSHAKSA